MLTGAIRFTIRNPFITIVLTVVAFAWGWHSWSNKTVDAIPDISENQVVVTAAWPGRSPQDVEDQITYPLATQLAGVKGVKEVRGLSGFGFSRIYVVFQETIRLLPRAAIDDFYESRTRVLEKLASVQRTLPEGVTPELGPDATALGQVFMYTVDGPYDLATLRSIQDFVVKYELQTVAGVAEVATVGGMVREYQVDVDPDKLRHYGVGINDVVRAIRRANIDVGAKTVEQGGAELILRGLGFIRSLEDVENVTVGTLGPDGFRPAAAMAMSGMSGRGARSMVVRGGEEAGTLTRDDERRAHRPLLVKDIATVEIGPEFRRGALADGVGERVGGIVAIRFGANPRDVVAAVRDAVVRLNEPASGILPKGVRIVPFYDRTQLIEETVETLETALTHELWITFIVVLVFLLHFRSALIIAASLPLAVITSFIFMELLGVDSNLMSLTGIAIAIGTMVDMAIVMTENIYRRLQENAGIRPRVEVIEEAACEVGPALITAVATTIVSFIPIFFLTDMEGKLFRPLAWTKTFALATAALSGVLIVPVLCRLMLRGKLRPLEASWTGRTIARIYEPTLRWVLDHKLAFLLIPTTIVAAGLLVSVGGKAVTGPVKAVVGDGAERLRAVSWLEERFPGLGQEFMPPLDEGSLLYMPSLLPQASLSQALEIMQRQNAMMEAVPEVAKVMGKLGRADSALDPAPIGMFETVVILKPRALWREGMLKRDVVNELMRVTHTPGVLEGAGAWLQPIETRVIMLSTDVRAPLAVRLIGAPRAPDGGTLNAREGVLELERVATLIRDEITNVAGVAGPNVENLGGKPYVEFQIDRTKVGHYGLTVGDVQDSISTAIGGMVIAKSLEGRERYGIRVAYPRELRDRLDDLGALTLRGTGGVDVPLSWVAEKRIVPGPAAIKTTDGRLRLHVMFAAAGRAEGEVMADVMERIRSWRQQGPDPVPRGVSIEAAGRFESQERARKRFSILIPICFAIILFLLYLKFRSWAMTANVLLAVPVCIAGGLLLMSVFPDVKDLMFSVGLWDQPSEGPIYLTVAVIVGFIALAGIATDDGVVMGTYLEQVDGERRPQTVAQVRDAVVEAGLRRIRPCLMTTFTTIIALYPILSSTGRGSDVAQPMAVPAVGGMVAELVSLFIVPCLFCWQREWRLKRSART